MKSLLKLLLLTPLTYADSQNELTLGCFDKSKNIYQIKLDIDEKKFSIREKEMVISEGLIAKITDSNNEINFQLVEMNTKDKKMVFKNKNILGELVCDV